GVAAQKYQDQTTIEQETSTIRPAYDALKVFVRKTMQDIRQGVGFSADDVKKVVIPVVASAVRNADALVCFAQLRRKADYTTLHSVRVCLLALAFGRHLGLGIADLIILGIGALLHDIG
ncbi:MAG: hypothetical protein GTO41_07750, partial [Burkholderiales bacterium]|nr:hypothetical protein [Burkholderiales bacterium]